MKWSIALLQADPQKSALLLLGLEYPKPMHQGCIRRMAKALTVDRAVLKAAFCKGVPLSELSKTHNIKLCSLRSISVRDNWAEAKAKSESLMQQIAHDAGIQHVAKVASHVSSKLDELMQFDYVGAFKTLDAEGFVRSLNTLDLIARRAYRLDEQQVKSSQTLVNIQVNGNATASSVALGDAPDREVLDIDSVQAIGVQSDK